MTEYITANTPIPPFLPYLLFVSLSEPKSSVFLQIK